jgi:hypothetical protein
MQRRLVLRGRGCCSSMPWDESIGGRRYMLEGLDGCELNARPRSRCPQFFSSQRKRGDTRERTARVEGRLSYFHPTVTQTLFIHRMDKFFLTSRINVRARMVPPISKYKI